MAVAEQAPRPTRPPSFYEDPQNGYRREENLTPLAGNLRVELASLFKHLGWKPEDTFVQKDPESGELKTIAFVSHNPDLHKWQFFFSDDSNPRNLLLDSWLLRHSRQIRLAETAEPQPEPAAIRRVSFTGDIGPLKTLTSDSFYLGNALVGRDIPNPFDTGSLRELGTPYMLKRVVFSHLPILQIRGNRQFYAADKHRAVFQVELISLKELIEKRLEWLKDPSQIKNERQTIHDLEAQIGRHQEELRILLFLQQQATEDLTEIGNNLGNLDPLVSPKPAE